jgi:hypothetical protein
MKVFVKAVLIVTVIAICAFVVHDVHVQCYDTIGILMKRIKQDRKIQTFQFD